MRNLMEKLCPVWEEPESKEAKDIISSGQIQLTLYWENGEQKIDANLKLKIGDAVVDLQTILRNRIEQGIRRFFTALAEAFDKSAGQDSRIAPLSDVKQIFIFLAGNSSKSPLVTELFREYIGDGNGHEDNKATEPAPEIKTQQLQGFANIISQIAANQATMVSSVMTAVEAKQTEDSASNEDKAYEPCKARKLLKFGDDQSMPEFIILPPLGTKKADEIRKTQMGVTEDTREVMMRPTGKTGLPYGLLNAGMAARLKWKLSRRTEKEFPSNIMLVVAKRVSSAWSSTAMPNSRLGTNSLMPAAHLIFSIQIAPKRQLGCSHDHCQAKTYFRWQAR